MCTRCLPAATTTMYGAKHIVWCTRWTICIMPFNFDFLQHFPSQIRVSGVYKGFDYYLLFFIRTRKKHTWARCAKKCRMIEQKSRGGRNAFPTTIRHHCAVRGKRVFVFSFSASEKNKIWCSVDTTYQFGSLICLCKATVWRFMSMLLQHCTTCSASIQRQSVSLQRRTSNTVFFSSSECEWRERF